MSNVTQNARVNVYINGQSARAEIDALEKKATQLRAEINKVGKDSDMGKGLQKQLNGVNNELRDLQKQGGLATMSLKQLKAEQQALTRLRSQATPNSEAWNTYSAQLKAVKSRITDVTNELGPFAKAWQSVSIEAKLAFGMLAGNALINWVSNNARALGDFDDALADVRKVTGLTKEQVQGINTELGKMNTRTARSELLELAYAGGKLGNQTTEDVLAFVRAADQINVALGKDLGRDAITQIGKLTDIFKLKEEFGLEQGMLKIGSAINEIGMASTATEGYLVEFAKRMSGVSGIANISAPEIIGLAGTLDSLGQTAEVSSTALSKLLTKMGGDLSTFARMAGMSEDAFRKLMGESGLKALLAVIEKVGQSGGGLETLAAQLGDIGLDGGRVVGVLGTLAKNMDEVRRQTDIANKAFDEGVSVTKEFEIKNATLGASLDTLGKDMRSVFVNNTTKEAIKSLVGVVIDFVRVLKENKDALISVAKILGVVSASWLISKAALAANNFLLKEGTIIGNLYSNTKLLLAGKINLATAAQKIWNTVLKENPVLLIVAGLYTLVKVFDITMQKIISLTTAEKNRVNSVLQTESATRQLGLAQQYMNQLLEKYLTLSKEERDIEMKKVEQILKRAQLEKANISQRIEQYKVEAGYYEKMAMFDKLIAEGWQKQHVEKMRASYQYAFVNKEGFKALQQSAGEYGKKLDEVIGIYNELYSNENAEKLGDSVESKTLAQLEKKLSLYQQALKLAQAETDQARINLKISEAQAKIKKIQETGISNTTTGSKNVQDFTVELERMKQQNIQFNEELLAMNEGTDEKIIEKTKDKYQKLIFQLDSFIKQQEGIVNNAKSTKEEKTKANASIVAAKLEMEKTYEYMEIAVKLKEKELAEIKFKARKDAQDKIDNMLELSDKEKNEREVARTIIKYEEMIKLAEKYGYKVTELRRAMYNEIANLRNKDAKNEAEKTGELIKKLEDYQASRNTNRFQNKFGNQGSVDVIGIRQQINAIQDYIKITEQQIRANEALGIDSEALKNHLNDLTQSFDSLTGNAEIGELANKFEFIGSTMLNAGNSINEILSMQSDERVRIMQQEADQRLESLEKLHKNGAISENQYAAQRKKILNDLGKEERKAQYETAKRQKALSIFQIGLSTIVGVMGAYAMQNYAMAVKIGIEGGIGLAAAIARPLPQLGKGKRFEGEAHKSSAADDHLIVYDFKKGQPVASVEGGETLLSKRTTQNNQQVVDRLLYVSQFENGRTLRPEELYGATNRVNTTEMPMLIRNNQMGNGGRFMSDSNGAALNQNSLLISKIDQLIMANNKLIEITAESRHVVFSEQRYQEFKENIQYFDQFRKP